MEAISNFAYNSHERIRYEIGKNFLMLAEAGKRNIAAQEYGGNERVCKNKM